jgi:hypothetical protein
MHDVDFAFIILEDVFPFLRGSLLTSYILSDYTSPSLILMKLINKLYP